MFWADMATTVPWESIVSGALGYQSLSDAPAAKYIGLLRWLKLVRARGHMHAARWPLPRAPACCGGCSCPRAPAAAAARAPCQQWLHSLPPAARVGSTTCAQVSAPMKCLPTDWLRPGACACARLQGRLYRIFDLFHMLEHKMVRVHPSALRPQAAADAR